MMKGSQLYNANGSSSMDNGSHQPIVDEIGEPQVLGQSRQSPASFYLAHQWLYDDGMKDSDVVPWVNTNAYPIWNEFHPQDLPIVDDQWSHEADQHLREPSPTCPPLALSTEANKHSNVAEETHLPATKGIRTRPCSLVSKGKNAATRRSHWDTAVTRIRTTHKISRESQRKRMRLKHTAGQSSRYASHLRGLAQAVPDLATLPPMVAEACRLWLKSFPGSLPKDEEIVGLHLAFHSSAESIRWWFHIHAGKKAKDGGPQGAMDPKDNVALQYQLTKKYSAEPGMAPLRLLSKMRDSLMPARPVVVRLSTRKTAGEGTRRSTSHRRYGCVLSDLAKLNRKKLCGFAKTISEATCANGMGIKRRQKKTSTRSTLRSLVFLTESVSVGSAESALEHGGRELITLPKS